MNAKQLKNALLQHAIQGRLVPQDPGDEPADVLLQRIRAEKEQLIKEGKIKKQKPLPPITEEEKPFAIPDSWQWVRLGEIVFQNIGGGTPDKTNLTYWNGDIPWASVKDLNCDILTSTKDHISQLGLDNSSSNLIQKGTIIICTRMGLGKIAITGIDTAINQDLRAIDLNQYTEKKFFVYLYKTLSLKGSGVTVKGIKVDELHNLLIPLPPLAEQRRIVARLEELLPDVEAYGTAQERLTAMESSFPQQLRKSLLQEAIQGRLVPQNPTDEPADVLLQRICAEKEQLIKEGKIKRQKPLPPITEEEKPFAIPDSWQWVRLGELGVLSGGKTPQATDIYSSGSYPYFKVSDMNSSGNEQYLIKTSSYIGEKFKSKIFKKNSIVFPKNGGAIFTNKKRILKKDSLVDLNTGIFSCYIDPIHIFIFHIFLNIDFSRISKGTALPTIDSDKLKNILVALPPLAEQQRIVARLEELLPLCDGLLSAGGQA